MTETTIRSANRLLGVAAGAAYLLLGVLGFAATAGMPFFSPEGGLLLGILQLNPAQNVLHIVIGSALLMAGLSNQRAAATVNAVVGAVWLVIGLASLFAIGTPYDILAVNVADNVLHFGSAAVLLAAGLGADKRD